MERCGAALDESLLQGMELLAFRKTIDFGMTGCSANLLGSRRPMTGLSGIVGA
jgi:hypothetical protein